jgi:CBS domain containing-hemolysin-like protein
MITSFEGLGVMSSVDEAAALLLRTTQQEFPVLDGARHLRGVVTRQAIIDALKSEGGGATPVLEVMAKDVPTVPYSAHLDVAFGLLQRTRAPMVGVVDAEGRFAGYITPENISELMMIRASREERSQGWLRG